MNYDVAIKEINTILRELGQNISDDKYIEEYVLPKVRKEISAVVRSIFSTETDRTWYHKWYDHMNKR